MSIWSKGATARRRRARYLNTRAQVRRVLEGDWVRKGRAGFERPEPLTSAEVGAAAKQLEAGGWRDGVRLDSPRVAAAFANAIKPIQRDLLEFLVSPLGLVAESTHLWPEVALAQVALKCLVVMFDSPDGLDARCEDLRNDLDELEQELIERGEQGPVSTNGWGAE